MKKISCIILALCLLLSGACAAAEQEYTADEVSGKIYTYEKEGVGSDFIIRIYPDGTFYYYVGMLSSYIGLGDWTVEAGILTLTDDRMCGTRYCNRFRIGGNVLTYLAEDSTGFMYLTPEDGERFHGAEMEPVDMAGHTGELLSLDLVRQLVLKGSREESIAALLSGVTAEELEAQWGETCGILFGCHADIWELDETYYLVVYYDGNSVVQDVRINENQRELPE